MYGNQRVPRNVPWVLKRRQAEDDRCTANIHIETRKLFYSQKYHIGLPLALPSHSSGTCLWIFYSITAFQSPRFDDCVVAGWLAIERLKWNIGRPFSAQDIYFMNSTIYRWIGERDVCLWYTVNRNNFWWIPKNTSSSVPRLRYFVIRSGTPAVNLNPTKCVQPS